MPNNAQYPKYGAMSNSSDPTKEVARYVPTIKGNANNM